MPADNLTAALRACAAGLYPLEAGTELLISNGTFLLRRGTPHPPAGGKPRRRHPVNLRGTITGLGDHHTVLLVTAFRQAAGRRA